METTEAGRATTGPEPSRRGPARSGLVGAVVGVSALLGGLLLATGGAGAQPSVVGAGATPTEADHAVTADADVDDGYGAEFDAELEPYVACVDGILADNGIDVEAEDEEEPDLSDAQWEAIETGIADCEDLLPAEVLAEWAEAEEAFEAYDACLVDNDLIDGLEDGAFEDDDAEYEEAESGAFVLVENEDGSTAIEFGDGDGQISLSKVDGEIVVATEGDVDVETIDWDELEAELDGEYAEDEAFEVCDELLDDLDLDGEFDDDEYDDEPED